MRREVRKYVDLQLRIAAFEYAEKWGNVAKACRAFCVCRASYYRWKPAYDAEEQLGTMSGEKYLEFVKGLPNIDLLQAIGEYSFPPFALCEEADVLYVMYSHRGEEGVLLACALAVSAMQVSTQVRLRTTYRAVKFDSDGGCESILRNRLSYKVASTQFLSLKNSV